MVIPLPNSHQLLLCLEFLHALHDVVVPGCWDLPFLLVLVDIIHVGFLLGVPDLQLGLFRPQRASWVLARPRHRFMQFLFILKVVASLRDMPSILDSLLLFEELSLRNFLQRIEVIFMDLVALDTWLFEAIGS